MKILLFGAEGQLGWQLQRSLQPLGEILALSRESAASTGFCGDLQDLDGLQRSIEQFGPKVIVNAAAYTQVDAAEREAALAQRINHHAPERMAECARDIRALLVHFSSEYVLADDGDYPRTESHPVEPLNVYGQSKLQGEIAIRSTGCRHLIFRSSWVHSARGHNFVRSILRLAARQDELQVVDDQIGSPTSAEFLADACTPAIHFTLPQRRHEGLYHLCARGHTSWHAYAQFIVTTALQYGAPLRIKGPEAIRPIASADYATPAQRPLNSRMNCQKFVEHFPVRIPHWRLGVVRTVRELLEKPQLWRD